MDLVAAEDYLHGSHTNALMHEQFATLLTMWLGTLQAVVEFVHSDQWLEHNLERVACDNQPVCHNVGGI